MKYKNYDSITVGDTPKDDEDYQGHRFLRDRLLVYTHEYDDGYILNDRAQVALSPEGNLYISNRGETMSIPNELLYPIFVEIQDAINFWNQSERYEDGPTCIDHVAETAQRYSEPTLGHTVYPLNTLGVTNEDN